MSYGQVVSGLIYLEDPAALDVARVGGKAASLAKLAFHGISVQPGIVVPVDVFERFVEDDRFRGLSDSDLAEAIEASKLDPTLAGQLRTAAGRLGERLVVRSSAVSEDGLHASWAGQFETVIGVRPGDETESALLKCWASAFHTRALAYKRRIRFPDRIQMGVLIQPVVEPKCAGVMFTINPLSGSWRELTVEAAWGQAHSVVQGEVVPDYHVVRRPRRSIRPLERIQARVQLDVVEDQIRRQERMCVVGANGLEVRPVPTPMVDAPKLRHGELTRLCRLGLKVESVSGAPQDIEWAMNEKGRFVILQARPVTTSAQVRRSGPALWTRRFIGERWTEPATPLGWSLVGGLLDEFIGYPDTQAAFLGGGKATRLVRFAPYLNVTVFRHLAFKLPGAPPPQFMMELLPDAEQRGWRRRHAQGPDLAVYGAILKETLVGHRWRLFSPGPFSNPRQWDGWLSTLESQLPSLNQSSHDVRTALALSERCMGLARQYIGIHVCSLLWANLLFQVSESVLSAKGMNSILKDALRPSEESWTVRTNHALWRLGKQQITMDTFLRDYGHRAASSWELFSPRWRDSEALVSVLAEAAAQHNDPSIMATTQAERSIRAVRNLSGWTKKLVQLTQVYLLLRENQRFHFDRLLDVWSGQLKQIESLTGIPIRFLEWSEVDDFFRNRLSQADAERIAAGRAGLWERERERREAGEEPPSFLVGGDVIDAGSEGLRLQGTGASPGVATGKVRVLRSAADGERLRPGEILVARATDPGWTPLFLKAGGVIMELGGMLSHGAVVAREYELPAVVNIEGATRLLEDGQEITLDGRQGVVWVR